MRIDVDLQVRENLNTDLQEHELLNTSFELGTMTEGIDPDYEKMRNLPSINGNELIGNKSSAELGIGIVGVYDNENITIGIQ